MFLKFIIIILLRANILQLFYGLNLIQEALPWLGKDFELVSFLKIYFASNLITLMSLKELQLPFISFVIRQYGSTLHVGLARAVSPTNTNFRLTFLLTRLQEALYEDLAV